ncbi:MAG: 4-hydroxy-tetrahydrodipicolinate reductase, partial [Planctomycetota bacterium]
MLRIGVNGAAGRMGKRLVALVARADDLTLVCALEAEGHELCGRDAGEVAGAGAAEVPIASRMEARPDVMIDFSSPASAVARAAGCAAAGVALVVGTTGLDEDQVGELEAASKRVACVFAPNMSVGVTVLAILARRAAEALGPDYDVEVVEAHHRFKKDAPSGTALKLARAAADGLGRDLDAVAVYGRRGMTGERTPE